jgi:DNA polymerase-3 subunit delta
VRAATLIVSDDDFLASEALDEIRREATAAGYAREELSGDDPSALRYALGTPSLFDAGRLIVVRDADQMGAEAVTVVAAFAVDPQPGVALALVAAAGAKADKLAKTLGKSVETIKTLAPAPWDTVKWLAQRIRERGRKISPEAAQVIVDAMGTDLRELAAVSAQLLDEHEGPIDVASVKERFHGLESKVYEFVDAVLDRDTPQALKRLRSLIEQGEHPLVIISALWRQTRIVAAVKDGPRLAPDQVARQLGVRAGQVKRAFRQARNFESAELRSAFALLADADVALKSEGQDDLVLDLLVEEIAAR